MKKLSLLLGATLVAAASSVMANPGHLGTPNFQDFFNVKLNGMTAKIVNIKTPDDQQLKNLDAPACSGTTCNFSITDNGTWMSSGTLTYDIGDTNGAYCQIRVSDGALYASAELNPPQCYGGAGYNDDWTQNGHQYTFSLTGTNQK